MEQSASSRVFPPVRFRGIRVPYLKVLPTFRAAATPAGSARSGGAPPRTRPPRGGTFISPSLVGGPPPRSGPLGNIRPTYIKREAIELVKRFPDRFTAGFGP